MVYTGLITSVAGKLGFIESLIRMAQFNSKICLLLQKEKLNILKVAKGLGKRRSFITKHERIVKYPAPFRKE